jgi:hypothetical protein
MVGKVILPGVDGSDFKFMKSFIENWFISFFTLIFVILWRVQLVTSLSDIKDKKAIQALPSARENARLIASHGKVIAAQIALSRTMGYEAKTLSDLAPEEREPHCRTIVSDLAANPAPRGSKILQQGQINAETIKSHRYGIMASLIGQWQSKPLFEPLSVLIGIPATSITITDVLDISQDLVAKVNPPAYDGPELDQNILLPLVKETIVLSQETPFNDGIYISSSNILPLETVLNFTRSNPSPVELASPKEGEKDPLLLAAMRQNEILCKNNNKVSPPSPKGKATSTSAPAPAKAGRKRSKPTATTNDPAATPATPKRRSKKAINTQLSENSELTVDTQLSENSELTVDKV